MSAATLPELPPDPYELLGVTKDADSKTIKLKYFEKVKQCHPDKRGQTGEFQLVQEAWETLKNEDKKAEYLLKLAVHKLHGKLQKRETTLKNTRYDPVLVDEIRRLGTEFYRAQQDLIKHINKGRRSEARNTAKDEQQAQEKVFTEVPPTADIRVESDEADAEEKRMREEREDERRRFLERERDAREREVRKRREEEERIRAAERLRDERLQEAREADRKDEERREKRRVRELREQRDEEDKRQRSEERRMKRDEEDRLREEDRRRDREIRKAREKEEDAAREAARRDRKREEKRIKEELRLRAEKDEAERLAKEAAKELRRKERKERDRELEKQREKADEEERRKEKERRDKDRSKDRKSKTAARMMAAAHAAQTLRPHEDEEEVVYVEDDSADVRRRKRTTPRLLDLVEEIMPGMPDSDSPSIPIIIDNKKPHRSHDKVRTRSSRSPMGGADQEYTTYARRGSSGSHRYGTSPGTEDALPTVPAAPVLEDDAPASPYQRQMQEAMSHMKITGTHKFSPRESRHSSSKIYSTSPSSLHPGRVPSSRSGHVDSPAFYDDEHITTGYVRPPTLNKAATFSGGDGMRSSRYHEFGPEETVYNVGGYATPVSQMPRYDSNVKITRSYTTADVSQSSWTPTASGGAHTVPSARRSSQTQYADTYDQGYSSYAGYT